MTSGPGDDAHRRVFVGDVHGCPRELDDLLHAVGHDPRHDHVLFVGDLVNKGPDSLAALRTAHALDATVVLGNHDLHLLRVAAGLREPPRSGVLDAVLDAADRDELLGWLRTRPLVRVDDDTVLVHAGLNPRWTDPVEVARPLEERLAGGDIPLDDPDLAFFILARHCDAEGNRPRDETDVEPGMRPWDDFHTGPRVAVFGHWAMRGLVERPHVRGLDTGCVYGGRLTAWIAEEDRLVSVPARETYVPVGG